MAKYLIASDAHIHPHKNSLQRLEHCLDALEWIFLSAVQHDVKDVLFLGDLFQDRQKIQVLPYHKTYAIFQKYAAQGLNVYMLVGNHDMWYADRCDISSVFPFNAIKNVTVIAQPTTLEISGTKFDFLPYTHNPLESMKTFEQPSRVLLGHVAIDGAKLNTFYKRIAEISVEYEGDMVAVNAAQFSKWERVFLGHFHAAQKIDNVEYVGSPLQLNFAEAFQEKHILILDGDTLKVEYLKNEFSPRHYIITDDELDKFDLRNSFVRIEPKDIASSTLVDIQNDLLKNRQALSVEVGDTPSNLNEQQEVDDAKSIMMSKDKFSMLVDYLEVIDCSPLNKDRLLEVGKALIEKSQVQ